jgi:membrane-bound lytic murein transglycosylase F
MRNPHYYILKRASIILFFLLIITYSCSNKGKKKSDEPNSSSSHALISILEKGVLSAITDYNSTNYFVYRGQPMGFQYELLNSFAEHLGVKLDVGISTDLDKTFSCLLDHGCDIIAVDLTITRDRAELFDFSTPIMKTKQVLVQRKPKGWQNMSATQIQDSMLNSPLEFSGITIYVQKNTAFVPRLQNLKDETGVDFTIIESSIKQEKLISMVASGEIDYTVSDKHVAMVNRTYYPNIDIETSVSFEQYLAWAVHKNSGDLLEEINNWLEGFKKTAKYKYIYKKYFENSKHVHITESKYNTLSEGKISPYDDLIKKHAKRIGWDWRLLASLIYQESHFQTDLTSWAGAFGLMQLMPVTAANFGIDQNASPDEQIRAGCDFILYLDNEFSTSIPDDEERISFILAAYNAGLGHVLDAKRLADKYGRDSSKWKNNVDTFILLKSDPQYYHDPVVKYGYSRGEESYNFVTEILERYEHYKNVVAN